MSRDIATLSTTLMEMIARALISKCRPMRSRRESQNWNNDYG